MDRLQFFFQQLVSKVDLNTQEDDIEAATRSVVADAVGFGYIVSATNPATAVQDPGGADLKLKINQLLGYDQLGQRLSNVRSAFQNGNNLGAVGAPQLLDMTVDENAVSTTVAGVGNEKSIAVFVKFGRNNYTPRVDGNNATVLYNADESCEFHVVQSAEALVGASVLPPKRTDQILLFDVVLIHNQTTITTGQVSYARQEVFTLRTKHGGSHVEGGADPVPNATDTVGGLESHLDKSKLDAIATTQTMIASGSNGQTLPQATINVASTAGFATSGTILVFTSSGTQTVTYGGVTGTSFTTCAGGAGSMTTGNAVTGGLPGGIAALLPFSSTLLAASTFTTPSATTQGVTANFSAQAAGGSTTVEGVAATTVVGTSARALILDANGNAYFSAVGNRVYGRITVDSVSTPTVWTLHFFTLIAGVETVYDFTPYAGQTASLWAEKFWRLDHLPGLTTFENLPRNREVGAVAGEKNTAAETGYRPILNFIEGSGVTLIVAENAGNNSIDVTITASGAGFPGFGAATSPDGGGSSGGGGSGGSSGVAAESDHVHNYSLGYALSVDGKSNTPAGTSFTTTTLHPRIAVGMGQDGTAAPIGVAWVATLPGTPNQASSQGNVAGTYDGTKFLATSGGTAAFGSWSSGSQTLTATHNYVVTYFVLGQSAI